MLSLLIGQLRDAVTLERRLFSARPDLSESTKARHLSATIGAVAADPYVADIAAIVDIAAEREVAGPGMRVDIGLVPIRVAIGRTVSTGVDQAANSQAIGAASNLGDRSHSHHGLVIALAVRIGLLVAAAVSAIGILTLRLGERRASTSADRGAVGYIVTTA